VSEGEAVSQTKREEKRRAARERKDAIQQQELSIEREREQAAFKALQESRQKGIMGRPSSYTDERADELCTWIAQGNSLRSFCKIHGMEAQTVYRWMRERPDFQQRYARAHEDRADSLADEMCDIADEVAANGGSIEAVQAARLRIDTRKWIAAKLRPGRWGEVQAPKAQTAVTFKIGLPLMDRGGGGITIDATPVAEALPDGAEAA
jgi:hypothetical protein